MHSRNRRNRPLFAIGLSLLLLLNLGLRLALADHGLPHLQIGDENSDLSTALRLTKGELPQWNVRYHRSLIAYVDASATASLLGFELISGNVRNLQDFQDLYFTDRWLFTLATRILMGLLTTAAVLFVGLTGRYLSELAGFSAALCLATNSFFLINSLFALPDGLVFFSVALFLWLTARMMHLKRATDYFFAGAGLALVMLSKFSASVVAVGLIAAHLTITRHETGALDARFWRRLVFDRRLVALGAGVFLGNIFFNPLGFIYPRDLIREFNHMTSYAYSPEANLLAQFEIIRTHLREIVPLIWRWMLPFSLIGIAAALRYAKQSVYWVVLFSFLALLITIGRVNTQFYKPFYWTPWLIPTSLLSGFGVQFLFSVISRKRRAIIIPALAAVLLLEGRFLIHIASIFRRPDTRELALAFVEQYIPAGTPIISGQPLAYSVPIQRNDTSIRRASELEGRMLDSWQWQLQHPDTARTRQLYDLYGPEMQQTIDSFSDMIALIETESIDYIIEADYCYGTEHDPASNSSIEYPALNDELRSHLTLLKEINPFTEKSCLGTIDDRTGLSFNLSALNAQIRTGPIIRIYEVNDGSAPEESDDQEISR